MSLTINGTTITKVVVNGTEVITLNVKNATDSSYTTVFSASTETIETRTTTMSFNGTTLMISIVDPDYGTIYTTNNISKEVTDSDGTVTEITKVTPSGGSVYSATYSGTTVTVSLYDKSSKSKVMGTVQVTYKVKITS